MYASEIEQLLAEPTSAAIAQLVELPEGQWLERKSGRIAAKDLSAPLVAMANAEGGYVIVGIHDGAVDGVDPRRANELRQCAADFTVPAVRTTVTELRTEEGLLVLVFRVDIGNRVHETNRGDVYLRVGDESRKLGYVQRRELEYDRGATPFDGTAADATVDELDAELMRHYQQVIGAASNDQMLTARDLVDRRGAVTVAAWLLFAPRPQRLFPSSTVRVLHYANTERGVGSRMSLYEGRDIRIEGPITQQIDEAAKLIESWIPKVSALGGNGRFQPRPIIPHEVWYEGLVNAVLHRSYAMFGDHVRVEIFPNRIEVTSPGRFPGIADPSKPLSISRYARNPRIVRVCSELGIARELGEGIKRMFAQMRAAGLTEPMYTQTSSNVQLTLSAVDALPESVRASLPKGALRLLEVLRQAERPLSTGQAAELAGVARPTASRNLQLLREHGLVFWDGASLRDPRASWSVR